jgi:hypothetical protein
MARYKVTPAMLKSGISTDQDWLLSDDSYLLSKSTTWPFKWAANLHAKYLIWVGYNCVNLKVEALNKNSNTPNKTQKIGYSLNWYRTHCKQEDTKQKEMIQNMIDDLESK